MPLFIYELPVQTRSLGGYGLREATITLPDGRTVTGSSWQEDRAVYNARRMAWQALREEPVLLNAESGTIFGSDSLI